MAYNKHEINELELVVPPIEMVPENYDLQKSRDLLGMINPKDFTKTGAVKRSVLNFFDKLRIQEGCNAVVTMDGQYYDTLEPGARFKIGLPLTKECKIYLVDVRDRTLTVRTEGEFYVTSPAPAQIDLTSVVTYRVISPRTVALEVDRPLGQLFDYVIEGMREAVKRHPRYQEFLTGGTAANFIYSYVQGKKLADYLGIDVLNVQISHVQGHGEMDRLLLDQHLHPGRAELEISVMKQQKAAELAMMMDEARTRGDVAKLLRLSPEYVALFLPERYSEIYGHQAQLDIARIQGLIELAKAGVINAEMLAASSDLAQALGHALSSGTISSPRELPRPWQRLVEPPEVAREDRPTVSAMERLRDEVSYMRDKGFKVEFKRDVGAYIVATHLRDRQGNTLDVYCLCTEDYPAEPPTVFMALNGRQEDFQSRIVQDWSYKHTIMDIVSEAMRFYE